VNENPPEVPPTQPIRLPLEATITLDLDGLWPDPNDWDAEDGPQPTDNRYQLINAVSQALADKLYQNLWGSYEERKAFEDNVKEGVKQRVLLEVDRVLDRGVQQTNSFGISKGETKPFIDFVTEAVEEWMAIRKDSSGYRTNDRGAKSELEKLVAAQVNKVMGEELTSTINEAKARVRQIVAKRAANELATSMQDVAEVFAAEAQQKSKESDVFPS